MLTRLISFFTIVIMWSSSAFAADVFTVSGVPVDAEGATAIEAQTRAISNGQLRAANMMIDRVTLESERVAKAYGGLSIENAAKLIRGMEIANEKRSSSRYLGDITVAFNPAAVQAYLRSRDLTLIATQARTRLVIPVYGNADLWETNGWNQAWLNPAYTHALTPLQGIAPGQGNNSVITTRQALSGDKTALSAIANLYGANQLLIAQATDNYSGVSVSLTDIALDTGVTRSLGTVNALNFDQAAARIVADMENDWKQAAVNTSANAVSSSMSVLYGSHQDWQQLQNVINTSSQILDARLDALSKDGALMTITYGGDINRLANELSYKGVKLETTADARTVLYLTSRR